jgi:hypothetical protein
MIASSKSWMAMRATGWGNIAKYRETMQFFPEQTAGRNLQLK